MPAFTFIFLHSMHKSIINSQRIISKMTGALLGLPLLNGGEEEDDEEQAISFFDVYPDQNSLASKRLIKLDENRTKW